MRDHRPLSASARPRAGTRGDHGRSAVVERADDLAGVESPEMNRGDPEVRAREARPEVMGFL